MKKTFSVKIDSLDSSVVVNAAEQLKKYIALCTGYSEENRENNDYLIFLKTDITRNDIKYDGYEIENGDGFTSITAREPRGILFGVYDFLEKYFGVRFLAPDCEIVPRRADFCLPKEKFVYNPKFPLRGVYNGAIRYDKEYASKCKIFYTFELTEEKYGGNCPWDRIDGLTGHNTLNYIKPEIYQKRYPEMFAYRNGSVSDICFSNGVSEDGKKTDDKVSCVTVICDYIKKKLAEDKTVKYFMIGQQDSWGGNEHECVCPRCVEGRKKYSSSGVLIRFLNVVSDEIEAYLKQVQPDREVYIVGFSYSQTFNAPVKKVDGKSIPSDPTVVPRKNVIMWLCQSGGLDWGINKQYSFNDAARNPVSAENYRAWLSICNKVMLWEYCTNYSEYFWYFPSLKMTQDSIRTLAQANCEYYFALFGYSDINEWQSLLKGYVAAKQIWNPSLNYQELVTEFLNGYYGAGAPYVQRLIDLFERHFQILSEQDRLFAIRGTKSDDILMNGNYYPEELLDQAENLIDEGIDAVEQNGADTEILSVRLNCVRLTPMRMRLYNYFMYGRDRQTIFDYFEKFKEIADRSGIRALSESEGMEQLEWQMRMLKELFQHETGAWDIYRYLYDGVVGNYQLPKREKK